MKKTNLLSRADMKAVFGGRRDAVCLTCDGDLVAFECTGNMNQFDANGVFVGGNWSPTNGGCSGTGSYPVYMCIGPMVEKPCGSYPGNP